MDKASDTLNMSQLSFLVDKMKQDEDRKVEKTVEIGGKKFTKFYKDE